MGLSTDLISQFAKITKDQDKTKTETTVYGVVTIEDGYTYVKFDGSDLLTRVNTTVDVENGDRVAVLLKNHSATITGNITSPAARVETVRVAVETVSDMEEVFAEMEKIIDDVATKTELDKERLRIDTLEDEITPELLDLIAALTDRVAFLETGLPRGYTLLKYVETNGTQYIDTEFKPNNNSRIVMDFESINDYTSMSNGLCPLFGARNGSSSGAFGIWFGDKTYPHYGNASYSANGYFTADIKNRIVYDMNKNVVTVNDTVITCTNYTFNTNYNLCLLAFNNYGTIDTRHPSGKLYSCQIYDDGVLIRDCLPCINTDGEIGLYDVVNRKFYGNAGTGTFIAGTD